MSQPLPFRPAEQGGSEGDSRGRFKKKIDALIEDWDGRLSKGESWADTKRRSAKIRKTFVEKVWVKVKDDYDNMLPALDTHLKALLAAKGIAADVQGRVKATDSIRATLARREETKLFASIGDVFVEMHDLVGLRIVPWNPVARRQVDLLIASEFSEMKKSAHISADRKVGEFWDVRFGAYESDNHRLSIEQPATGPRGGLEAYEGVMFEVQVTTWSTRVYNILAHYLLYKSKEGGAGGRQGELMMDLLRGSVAAVEVQLEGLLDRILEARAAKAEGRPDVEAREAVLGEEDAFAKLGPELREAIEDALTGVVDSLESRGPAGSKAGQYLRSQAAELRKTLACGLQQQRSELEQLCERLERDYQESLARTEREQRERLDRQELKNRREALCHSLEQGVLYRNGKNRNPGRAPETCKWLTNDDRFKDWLRSDTPNLLWVSAEAGCGKSVLARYLVDERLAEASSSRIICYFFFKDEFKDSEQKQDDANVAICCILSQIFARVPELLTERMLDRFEQGGPGLQVSFQSLWEILVEVSKQAAEITCVLDGLDECEKSGRRRLTKALSGFYGPPCGHGESDEARQAGVKSKGRLKILLTSRPETEIRQELRFLAGPRRDGMENRYPCAHIEGGNEAKISQIEGEISMVTERFVSEIAGAQDLDRGQERAVLKKLTSVPNRTYLWVHLMREHLGGWIDTMDPRALQQKLETVPETVDQAYEKILSKSPDYGKTTRLLHILIAAFRPLTLKEIAIAWAVDSLEPLRADWAEKGKKPFAAEDIKPAAPGQTAKTIRRLCGSLITIQDGKVHFIHQTAKEFLIAQSSGIAPHIAVHDTPAARHTVEGTDHLSFSSPKARFWKSSLNPAESHYMLAVICVKYLGSQEYDDEYLQQKIGFGAFLEPGSVYLPLPFFDYSAEWWMFHLEMGGGDGLSSWATSYMETLTTHAGPAEGSAREQWELFCGGTFFRWSPLAIACFEGDQNRVERLVKCLMSLNRRYGLAGTALHIATLHGHETVVEILLSTKRVDVNARTTIGETALHIAARKGHETIVKLLLNTRQADANIVSDYGGTPLHSAVLVAGMGVKGATEVAKLLIDAKTVDVNTAPSRVDGTPLHGIIYIWGVVERMSEWHLHPTQGGDGLPTEHQGDDGGDDDNGKARKQALKEIAQALIGSGKLNPNVRNGVGCTPLYRAICLSQWWMVEFLLKIEGIDINMPDMSGMTPLALASSQGLREVVKALVATGKINADYADPRGRTALFHVAEHGHSSAVKLLLRRGNAGVNKKDEDGRTPLYYASCRPGSNMETFSILLRHGADPDVVDEDGQSLEDYIRSLDRIWDKEKRKMLKALERRASSF